MSTYCCRDDFLGVDDSIDAHPDDVQRPLLKNIIPQIHKGQMPSPKEVIFHKSSKKPFGLVSRPTRFFRSS